jgi:3-oxoacyl-[acyl-carrier-protein] synthase II
MTARVVVTGMAGLTSLGHEWDTVSAAIHSGHSGIRRMDEWRSYEGLNTLLGGPIDDYVIPEHYPRKKIRAMGRVACFAVTTAERALAQAGLLGSPVVSSGACGIAYGSSSGSFDAIAEFGAVLSERNTRSINSTSYIKMMSHTAAVNTALFFSLRGRVITTSTACTSGSQAIGYAYETIKHGAQQLMIAGGAEEISPVQAAVFDTLFATSVKNDAPSTTPRPFDRDRDGLVIGEGATTLVLENLDAALARGAKIHAEVVGFGTNCDAMHVTQPTAETMEIAMRQALRDAGLTPDAIGYVSAHGTATELGDIAESVATYAVLGGRTPISCMKSYFGHTLGACGAQEAWLAIEMMNRDVFAPTLNLAVLDTRCADLDYIVGGPRTLQTEYVMSNNFAFGGINTSHILRRWS